MFTLLPGVGVELPHGAGTLRFGMSEHDAQWAVSTLADVRESWVCGAAWAFGAAYGDLVLGVLGGPRRGAGLAEVSFERPGGMADVAGRVPVVWADVDLFGYPLAEVETALPRSRPAYAPAPGRTAGPYVTHVRLAAPQDRSATDH
ncbi:hypothetical protein [Actinoallomurus sp. CA-142502]|uniref:hypothetical protein n=1 Tax=Actinoallomurus sp. CA-142502 TaxID=3239885 RepID=UPI003D8F9D64